jgi:hypothetical protein
LTDIDINKLLTELFASKRESLRQAIKDITPEVGKQVSTVVIPPILIAFTRNIGDLYDLQEITIKSVLQLKTEIDSLAIEVKQLASRGIESTNIQSRVDSLEKKYNDTLGSLADVIDKIKERESKASEGSHYG